LKLEITCKTISILFLKTTAIKKFSKKNYLYFFGRSNCARGLEPGSSFIGSVAGNVAVPDVWPSITAPREPSKMEINIRDTLPCHRQYSLQHTVCWIM